MKEQNREESQGSQTQANVQEQLQRCKMAQTLLASWLGLRSTKCFSSTERGTNLGTVLPADETTGAPTHWLSAAIEGYLQRAQAAKRSCVSS